MKTTLVLFLSACLYAAATRSQTGTKNVSVDNVTLSDGKFVEQKLCTSSTAANEITSLKKEVKQLKEVLLQRLDELLRRLGKTTIMFLVLMIYLSVSIRDLWPCFGKPVRSLLRIRVCIQDWRKISLIVSTQFQTTGQENFFNLELDECLWEQDSI